MPWRKRLRQSIGITTALLLLFFLWPIQCYRYPPPRPFSGKTWYNPFQSDSLSWSRANFHIHSRTWWGLTDGEDTPITIDSAYKALGYAYTGISDYQKPNPASQIPLYEHGWGPRKFHQLVFAPQKVIWWDFPWPFSLDIYQSILSRLYSTSPLIAIAHPRFHPYITCSGKIIRHLRGYHAIEVLNRYGDSIAEWDSALSAGHYATLLAHDNLHSVQNPHQITSRWTEIALPPGQPPQNVMDAILQGKTAGYKNKVFTPIPAGTYPTFRYIKLRHDTLYIETSSVVDSLRVIGQGGLPRAIAFQTATLKYPLRADDTYLRVELYTASVEAYSSPLCRGDAPTRHPPPEENTPLTLLWKGALLTGVAIWLRFWLS